MMELIERVALTYIHYQAFLVAQLVKNPPAMQGTWVQSLGWEDPLKEGVATHSSILAWRIPGMAKHLCPWDSPYKNTRVGCHALFQGIFPT